MTQSAHIALFAEILSSHRGLDRAISVAEMAARLNVSEREARDIKRQVIEQHKVPVGSSTGKHSGWYWISTQEEMDATIGQYRSRVKSLCILIAMTTSAGSLAGVMRQMALEFEEEQVHEKDMCAL